MRPTKKTAYIGLALLVFSLALLAGSAICLAAPTFNTPVNSDGGHVANAISLSGKAFAGGAPAVVVTSVDSYADSLTAAVLAKAYAGPLLLTSASALSADVATELTRLKPTKVFLVGLPSTFVARVKAAVPALTAETSIVVIKGADRYETAALVARAVKSKLGTVSKVVVAPGDSYGAALAASSLAAAQGWPLLLTPAAGPFPQSAKDAIADLGVSSGLVVGTNVALGVDGFTVSKRIVGATSASDPDGRYDACAALADYAVAQGWLSYAHLGLVSGEDYPDGEAAVAFVARDQGVLLFAKPTGLAAATSTAIKDHGTEIKKIDFVGVGWPVFREVKSLNSARVTGLGASSGPVGGGNKLVITGTALTGASRVRVGKVDVPASNWKADSSTQLTITSVPPGYGDGPVEVTVFNFWGASPATTKDLYWYGGDGVLSPGEKVVRKAVEYLGVPYLWAGASPTGGFDCSGFCMYVYKQFGVTLPHYSRSQATYGTAVSKDSLQPGDLIFFYTPISHVGMYVGGGMMINAPRSGDLVTIEDAFRSSYVTARRMVSPYTRYEQSDSHLGYAGTWSKSTTTSASGGDFVYANAKGTSVTITFTGTYLGLIAKKSSAYGIAKVTLDNKTPVMVDLYSAGTAYVQKVWNSGNLTAGSHTVRIEWTGTKNAAATDTNIGLDGLDLIGNLTQATATPPASSPTATRYEQTDARLSYTGTWGTGLNPGASGGSWGYANTGGSLVTAKFTGTSIAWVTVKSPNYGIAQVTLDGGAPLTVDLYSPGTTWQQKVWSATGLSDSAHTLTIAYTGTKNPAAARAYIGVDAFDVQGTLTQASSPPPPPPPASTRFEQTDSHIAFAGTWATFSATGPSGGSYLRANTSGASATIAFTGTYLSWIATRGTTLSKAKVSLDGGAAVSVDLAASAVAYQQRVWNTGTLPEGAHTVKISWDPVNAAGKYISVDAVEVIGTLTTASATSTTPPTSPTPSTPPTTSKTPTPAPTTNRYEQTDARFSFAGGWTASSSSSASAGSFRFADSAGSAATATFNGTFLAWIGKKSPAYGKAKVTVDGGTPLIVDLFSADTKWKQKLWDTGTLAAGAHTVKIEWTGTKSAAATGTNINVDAFDIAGTLGQAPAAPATRWEQNDSHFAYAGTWTTSSSSAASAGNFRFANSTASSVTVTFVGSYLSWIAKKSPVYGKARVTLDAGTPVLVDLYSAKEVWKQKVWETKPLVPGTHTVKIEWTGTKNAAATGTNIGVDAFDVIGLLK